MPHFRLETNIPQSSIPGDLSIRLANAMPFNVDHKVATVIGGVQMAWNGSNEPAAWGTIRSMGAPFFINPQGIMNQAAPALFSIINQSLGIPCHRIYISVESTQGCTGYNGSAIHTLCS